jgi:hypothetical protein
MTPTITLPLPKFGFIVGTRVALGVGLGLLLADRLPRARRLAAGRALLTGGVLSTAAALMWMRLSMRRARAGRDTGASVEQDDRLIGAERFPRRGDDELSD